MDEVGDKPRVRDRGGIYHVILFFQAEDGIRDLVRSRGLGDVYKRQTPQSRVIPLIEHTLEQRHHHGRKFLDRPGRMVGIGIGDIHHQFLSKIMRGKVAWRRTPVSICQLTCS